MIPCGNPSLTHPNSVKRQRGKRAVSCRFVLLTCCVTLLSETVLFASGPLVRDIRVSHDSVELVWEGSPGSVYTIESAEYLAPRAAFAPLVENIPAIGILTTNSVPLGPDFWRYFRVLEQGGSPNRFGKVVLISDFHLSPFLNRATTEALVTNDITLWDGLFSTTTNGFFTPDATGSKTTTPLLFNSALNNARGTCPHPDAVIFPGDFPYHGFISWYTNITQTSDVQTGKALLIKTIAYCLMKIRQSFPAAPVYFALGNNDTFGADYDMAATGDEFYAETAPLLYDGPLTNVLSYAAFAATYTNSGNYTAPFGRGDIITLQSTYFSANYPRGLAPGTNQLAYLEAQLQKSAAANRPVWLLLHIPPGVNPMATWGYWKSNATDTVTTDWDSGFLAPFCAIVARYTNTISGVFCGHYHLRDWRLISDPVNSNAIATVQTATGLLFDHGNNPGFTILTYDRNTLGLVNESTYSLDYATWYGSLDSAASWSVRYNQNQGYNIPDLAPSNLLSAWTAMRATNTGGFSYYNNEYIGGRTPLICTASNWPVYYNTIRWTIPQQFLDNARSGSNTVKGVTH